MLHLGPWQIAIWPRLLVSWDAFGSWLAGNPFYGALLLAACFIWAARGDSWRVHILPVPGLLLVVLARLAALGSVWLANLALAPPLWCNELRLAVMASVASPPSS